MSYTIKLKTDKILIQPETGPSSSFNTEVKRYDRKSIAIVKGVGQDIKGVTVGDRVIYDDSNSIDFTFDSINLSVITPDAIVARIETEKEAE